MQLTESDPRILLGEFLTSRSSSAKELARQIDCDPRSAESYRAGRHWPPARHWMGLIRTFGEDVTEAVFHPDKAAQRLEREVQTLEHQLAEARRAAKAAADAARHSPGRRQTSHRAARADRRAPAPLTGARSP